MTDMTKAEKQPTDKTLKGVLSKKFANELSEAELFEMESSLFELCKLLLNNYIETELEGVK